VQAQVKINKNQRALTWGCTYHFSNIFLQWTWTLTYDLDLWTWPRERQVNHHVKHLAQRSFSSKLLSRHIDTHTQWTDCSTWTTKVAGKNSIWWGKAMMKYIPRPRDLAPGLKIHTLWYPSSSYCGRSNFIWCSICLHCGNIDIAFLSISNSFLYDRYNTPSHASLSFFSRLWQWFGLSHGLRCVCACDVELEPNN